MLADSHGRLPRPRRGWPTLGRPATLLLALAMFAGVYALSRLHPRAATGDDALYLLPIALLALRFGLRGGAGGALLGLGLALARDLDRGAGLPTLDYASGAIAFILFGVLLGVLADELRSLKLELQRRHGATPELLAEASLDSWITRAGKAWESVLAERTRELESTRTETLQRLALAAEYRDDATSQHTERVGETAARIGQRLGLEAGQVAVLREAATLHDVGKLAVPDRILLKPGRLSQQEYEVMKRHAMMGARLLSGTSSPVLQMAAVIAATHHERWDGAGYPRGLAGEAIPLVGRIVAVADVFDALTHERPYRSLWPVEQSIAEIRRAAGTQFDPGVVDAFLEIQADAPPGSLFGERASPARHTPVRRRRASAPATPARRPVRPAART